MSGLGAAALLRFREAVAARMLWLVPLHFMIALPVAHAMPGPTTEDRRAAADAAALALAALLAVVAASVMGAGPLPAERDRPRGTMVLAAPVSPLARVLGTALGTGAALSLLAGALLASALAAVDLGVGPAPPPRAWIRAASIDGGEPDPREEGLVWLTVRHPRALVEFDLPPPPPPIPGAAGHSGADGGPVLRVEARPRVGADGEMPGRKRIRVLLADAEVDRRTLSAPLFGAFETALAWPRPRVELQRVPGNLDLGVRLDGILLDDGPRPRAWARALHATALLSGLLALMAAALALSTFVGSGVGAAGALALVLLGLSKGLFADAARLLSHAGAMERALHGAAGHDHGAVASPGAPPALAPLFEALATILPDARRFDLGDALVGGAVPDGGEVLGAVGFGLLLAAAFLAVASLGARRRP